MTDFLEFIFSNEMIFMFGKRENPETEEKEALQGFFFFFIPFSFLFHKAPILFYYIFVYLRKFTVGTLNFS